MKYEWDAAKSARNERQRCLPFAVAQEMDLDGALVEEDRRQNYPERRFVAYGFIDTRLHVLCFTPIIGGIRIISFRKANAREVKRYEQTFNE